MEKIRWGILATGNIADKMAQALQESRDAAIVAVASRTQDKADAFGAKWHIPNRYNTYAAVAADPNVDIVYIATPHSCHYDNMQLCLQAGKHVLCEKAFTLNARQAEACMVLAREHARFLMEAMWMRFFPSIAQVRAWLQQGMIGDIRFLQADFCVNLPFDPQNRLYNLALGGGALLDMGIYPLSLAAMVLGLPQHMSSQAHLNATGADELDTIMLTYGNGATALLTCSMRLYKPREAFIVGTKGYIKIHDVFFRSDRLTLHIHGEEPRDIRRPYRGNGFMHEIEEVHGCLRAGQTESQIMPLDETLQLMKLMDALRADWGVVYPDE